MRVSDIFEKRKKNLWVECVFLDREKAFHRRLMKKLDAQARFRGGIRKRTDSYLPGNREHMSQEPSDAERG